MKKDDSNFWIILLLVSINVQIFMWSYGIATILYEGFKLGLKGGE